MKFFYKLPETEHAVSGQLEFFIPNIITSHVLMELSSFGANFNWRKIVCGKMRDAVNVSISDLKEKNLAQNYIKYFPAASQF